MNRRDFHTDYADELAGITEGGEMKTAELCVAERQTGVCQEGIHGMNEPKDISVKPCPFCGEKPELTKHHRYDVWNLIHRCKVFTTMSIDWSDLDRILERWNTRSQ